MNDPLVRTVAQVAIAVALWLIFLWGTGTIGQPVFRIGWKPTPQSENPGDPWPAGEYVIKAIVVPKGSWVISLPIRVRWGGPGQPGPNHGLSIMWRDPIEPTPIAFAYSDHQNIESGTPGDADVVYPLSCGIVVSKATELVAVLTTTGVNQCHVVDGDGLRWASAPW